MKNMTFTFNLFLVHWLKWLYCQGMTCWLAGGWLITGTQCLRFSTISRQALDVSNLFSCRKLSTYLNPSPKIRSEWNSLKFQFGGYDTMYSETRILRRFNLHVVQAKLPYKQQWIFCTYMSVLPNKFLQYIHILKLTVGILLSLTL
jgi:hypothetical protein